MQCLAHDNCLGFYGFRRPVFHSKLAFELSYNPAFMCHQNIVLRLLGACSRQQQLASSSWHYMAMRNRTRSPGTALHRWRATIILLARYYEATAGWLQGHHINPATSSSCWLAGCYVCVFRLNFCYCHFSIERIFVLAELE